MSAFLVVSLLYCIAIRFQSVTSQYQHWEKLTPAQIKQEWPDGFKWFLNRKLGGLILTEPYEGGGLPIHRNAHSLDCSFEHSHKCCWTNVGGNNDEFDWILVDTIVPPKIFFDVFLSHSTPQRPYMVTGSQRTFPAYQALLVSCPIVCQKSPGILTISHWLTPGAKIDVCRIELGKRDFLDNKCETLDGSRTSSVKIDTHKKPFYIVLVASGFSHIPKDKIEEHSGGLAIIDDIVYHGAKMCED